MRPSHKSRLERGRNQDLLKANSRGSGVSVGARAWKKNKTPNVDLISASQISSKAWSQPISAFPQTWKRFFFFFYDPSWKAGMATKPKGAAQAQKNGKKVSCENSQKTHKAQGVEVFIPAPFCRAAPLQIVWFNWRLRHSQTPVAHAFTNWPVFVSDSSSYLIPAG